MRYARTLLVTALAAALFSGCTDDDPTAPQQTVDEFDWRGTVAQGDRIEIKNIGGDVRASYTSGNEVVVHAIKSSQKSDMASVTIEVVRHAEGVTICAVYPDVPGWAPNECQPGLQGNMSTRNSDVKVEFTVAVPAGVEFAARVIGGDVAANGLRSNAFATTTSGNISMTTTEIAEANSVAGDVKVVIGRANLGRDLAFRTMKGNVTLKIPSNTNAVVQVRTAAGRIDSDFPLVGTSRHRSGTLGKGGPTLILSTMDGNVDLQGGPAN